jgi:hypothetical protein
MINEGAVHQPIRSAVFFFVLSVVRVFVIPLSVLFASIRSTKIATALLSWGRLIGSRASLSAEFETCPAPHAATTLREMT